MKVESSKLTGVYLGMAKDGEKIVLESSDNGRFELVPIIDRDIISDEYILKLKYQFAVVRCNQSEKKRS